MILPRVIGLSGLAHAGKSTAARWLRDDHGYHILPFAFRLKQMASTILTYDQLHSRMKEVPDPLLGGKTPRQFMQLLGTEFGRQLISDTLWVDLWLRDVRRMPDVARIVADDVRFANEATAIRSLGGIIIEISRDGAGSASGGDHVSETLAVEPDFRVHANTIEEQTTALMDLARHPSMLV